jgi:hypothetical protein
MKPFYMNSLCINACIVPQIKNILLGLTPMYITHFLC